MVVHVIMHMHMWSRLFLGVGRLPSKAAIPLTFTPCIQTATML